MLVHVNTFVGMYIHKQRLPTKAMNIASPWTMMIIHYLKNLKVRNLYHLKLIFWTGGRWLLSVYVVQVNPDSGGETPCGWGDRGGQEYPVWGQLPEGEDWLSHHGGSNWIKYIYFLYISVSLLSLLLLVSVSKSFSVYLLFSYLSL